MKQHERNLRRLIFLERNMLSAHENELETLTKLEKPKSDWRILREERMNHYRRY